MIKIKEGHINTDGKASVILAELTTLLYFFMTDDNPLLREIMQIAYKDASEYAKRKMEGKL